MINIIKKCLEKTPASIGTKANIIPFNLRLGKSYADFFNNIEYNSDILVNVKKQKFVSRFENILNHFSSNNNYYKDLLVENNFEIDTEINFDSINSIPILNKSVLNCVPLEERSCPFFALDIYNTGGTSGKPLSFFLEKGFYAREWSHMHFIWKKIGYHPSKTKLTFRGRKINEVIKYNFNQNEFLIDSYHEFSEKDYYNLYKIIIKYNIEFIHGYPSAIYNFLKDASVKAPFVIDILKKRIKGIMFGSEYPAPHFRNFIEDLITANTVSWYGHTEGVILAAELYQKFEYIPFLSYGYAEAVLIHDQFHLVGTSFHNLASPFIRYDTEDIILPNFNSENIMTSFEIKDGRIGEFIIDSVGHNISLTSLIFGRHHPLFNFVKFIQVKQVYPGMITIYYCGTNEDIDPVSLFDSSDLSLHINFEKIDNPFKTNAGKIPLLIK